MRVKQGGQKIYFNKRSDLNQTEIEEVDWESWSLKKSKNELHNLTLKLASPTDWIDKTSPTGLKCIFGDEIGLYASFGGNEEDTKRFGGYISGIDSTFDGSLKVGFDCRDYKISLKNKQVFKDYYKNMPQSIGQYSQYINKLYTSTSLYDSICALCNNVNITDFSLLESPYKWVVSNATPLTRTTGSNSTCTTYSGLKNPIGANSFTSSKTHQIKTSPLDTEVVFTIYSDGAGYDLMAYPHIGLSYHRAQISNSKLGFKFIINGTTYYLPWFSDLNEYTGNFLTGLVKTNTTQLTTLMIPIKQLMDDMYPDVEYKCTYIGLVSKELDNGYIYLANIGAIDGYQALPMTHEYAYKDSLEVANLISTQCNHIFDINPYKQPILKNRDNVVTNLSIIEGVNLISASLSCDDSEYSNNSLVICKQDDTKAIVAQEIDLQSMNNHGEYDFVEENSEITTDDDAKKYVQDLLKQKSAIIPEITCKVEPSFEYEPGDVIYVYIPSMGIERSLEIQEVTITNTGDCEVIVGYPNETLQTLLLNLSKKQKLGQNRNSQNMDKTTQLKRELITNTGAYIQPRGKIVITGKDLVETGVDLYHDQITEYCPMWPTKTVGDFLWRTNLSGVGVDERGITVVFNDDNGQLKFPVGIPFYIQTSAQLEKITVTYSYGDLMSTPGQRIYLDVDFYSHFNPYESAGALMTSSISNHAPTSSSGTVVASLDLNDTTGYTLPDLPFLNYYHLLFTLEEVFGEGWIRIEKIEIEYVSEGRQENV